MDFFFKIFFWIGSVVDFCSFVIIIFNGDILVRIDKLDWFRCFRVVSMFESF